MHPRPLPGGVVRSGHGTATTDRYGEWCAALADCITDSRSGRHLCAAKEGGTTLTDPASRPSARAAGVPASQSVCSA
jgi:hypothetical protein